MKQYVVLDKDNNIVQVISYTDDFPTDDLPSNYILAEQEIKRYSNGKLVFASDYDNELEQSIIAEQQAEMQAQAEEEMLKPTVEDLAEALDILTNIVLGGAE